MPSATIVKSVSSSNDSSGASNGVHTKTSSYQKVLNGQKVSLPQKVLLRMANCDYGGYLKFGEGVKEVYSASDASVFHIKPNNEQDARETFQLLRSDYQPLLINDSGDLSFTQAPTSFFGRCVGLSPNFQPASFTLKNRKLICPGSGGKENIVRFKQHKPKCGLKAREWRLEDTTIDTVVVSH
mmetsp:Transcript_11160/g.21946  ORF Transcript_11160/g.21946 Transcript_11160/m.21946 type:complete len:183 (-) Transcript_11160:295-843(-)